MKKLLSMILIFALVLSFSTIAFAADTERVKGSITINDAEKEHTYSIYKILDLYSYKSTDDDTAYEQFVYTANTTWAGFITTAVYDAKTVDTEEDDIKYFTVTTIGEDEFVTWNTAIPEAEKEAAAKALAKRAKAYADTNNVLATAAKTANSDTVEFTGLELGYYLLDSTAGILCSLDTTDPDVEIEEKNGVPKIIKNVREDSKAGKTDEFGKNNDAAFFQEVVFEAFVNVEAGGQNYEMHDKMDKGLTYTGVSKVEFGKMVKDETTGIESFVAESTIIAGDDTYEVINHTTDGTSDCTCEYGADCTFTVDFVDSYVEGLEGKTIRVEYKATVNVNAVVESTGNVNEVFLEYGDENKTVKDATITYVHKFEILKYDANKLASDTNKQSGYTHEEYAGAVIDGAEFKLYNALTGGNEIPVVQVTSGIDGEYRVAESDDTGVVIKTVNGVATIIGFDSTETNCRYFLEEIKAPAGYNKLKDRKEIEVTTYKADDKGDITEVEIAYIGNNQGVELPSTGGIGTAVFYIVGGIMTVGAMVVLITRKRMGETE